jgi:predicted nucleic acid-binding protein
MSRPGNGPVVIDTGVFGVRLMPRGGALASGYGPLTNGRPAVVSFVTVAELGFGARPAGWGSGASSADAGASDRSRGDVAGCRADRVYADLRAWCVHHGHGLGQKEHEADRWVAATALHLGVPLVAHDRVFVGVDDLELITRL